jgi:hypothetical protein
MTGDLDQPRIRRLVAATPLAVAALLTLSLIGGAAAPAVASAPTIAMTGRTLLGTQSQPSYKPSSVTVVQNGVAFVITRIHWRHWDSARAVGRGTGRAGSIVGNATLVATARSYCTAVGAFVYDDLRLTLGPRRG